MSCHPSMIWLTNTEKTLSKVDNHNTILVQGSTTWMSDLKAYKGPWPRLRVYNNRVSKTMEFRWSRNLLISRANKIDLTIGSIERGRCCLVLASIIPESKRQRIMSDLRTLAISIEQTKDLNKESKTHHQSQVTCQSLDTKKMKWVNLSNSSRTSLGLQVSKKTLLVQVTTIFIPQAILSIVMLLVLCPGNDQTQRARLTKKRKLCHQVQVNMKSQWQLRCTQQLKELGLRYSLQELRGLN